MVVGLLLKTMKPFLVGKFLFAFSPIMEPRPTSIACHFPKEEEYVGRTKALMLC